MLRLTLLAAAVVTALCSAAAAVPAPAGARLIFSRDGAVWIASVDGTAPRRLAAGTAPSISPDGRWVAYFRCEEASVECRSLHLVPAGGGRPRVLVSGGHFLGGEAEWSPDSRRLAVLGVRSLLLFELHGGVRTIARGGFRGFDFSPDGRWLAYASQVPRRQLRRTDLFVAATETREIRRLTRDGRSAAPVWGPERIAFVRWRWRRGWPANELWTMRPDGSGARSLATRPRPFQGAPGLEPVAWSRDGRRLLAGFTTEFDFAPYAVDPRTGRVRALPTAGLRASTIAFSGDGEHALVWGYVFDRSETARVFEVSWSGDVRVLARRVGFADWNR